MADEAGSFDCESSMITIFARNNERKIRETEWRPRHRPRLKAPLAYCASHRGNRTVS
jgi:hypothetical protein